jgi:hypothetical protein
MGCCEHCNEPLVTVKENTGISFCELLKKNSAPWSQLIIYLTKYEEE